MIQLSRSWLLLAAAAALASPAAAGAQPFSPDLQSYVWDLQQQYPNGAAWDADLDSVRQGIVTIGSMRGRAGRSPKDLADVLDAVSWLRGTAARMARFALLNTEIDGEDGVARARLDAATGLEIRVESAVAWLDPEVRAIGRDSMQQWLKAEGRLDRHRRRLHRIFYEAGHLPPPGTEAALAAMERWPRTAADAADALLHSNAGWPMLTIDGKPLAIDGGAYVANRRSPDRARREAVTAAYLSKLKDLEEPLGLLLARRIEGEMAIAGLRGIPNSIDAAFILKDNVDPRVWRTMIDVVHDRRPTLVRAAQVLRRVHGVDRMTLGDFYARKAAPPREILVPQAMEIAAAALAPMGAGYQRDLRRRLSQPWMHLPPGPNKGGTVGVFWQAGGGHPYSLLTYSNDTIGSTRFAQAATLMMWYADIADRYAPDRREEDPPIHGNAIWYVGRFLHDNELLKRTTDREQRIALLVDSLYFMWSNYFQNVVSAEFEQAIVEAQLRGAPLTGAQMSERYLGLLRAYYGHGAGGADVPELYAVQWMANEQLFYSHTQVVWAAAMAAGSLWAERIQAGDRQAISGIRLAQTAEGSQYSGDLFRAAGIDPAGRQMHEALIRRYERTLDRLEKALAAQP